MPNPGGVELLNGEFIMIEMGIYIQGQAQVNDGLMGILDIERLLFKQEK